MSNSKEIIESFRSMIPWASGLGELDDFVWFKPIAEGKASTAEIISHLQNWDRYLISNVIPSVQGGGSIVFPNFDPFNAIAYIYAKSGIARNRLLKEFCAMRAELCDLLAAIGDNILLKPVAANGVELCPHTGTPYSILYIIQEFIEHDHHHKAQIDKALMQS